MKCVCRFSVVAFVSGVENDFFSDAQRITKVKNKRMQICEIHDKIKTPKSTKHDVERHT